MSSRNKTAFTLLIQGHKSEVQARSLQSAVHKASKDLISRGRIENKPRWNGTEWLGVEVVSPEIHTSEVKIELAADLFPPIGESTDNGLTGE